MGWLPADDTWWWVSGQMAMVVSPMTMVVGQMVMVVSPMTMVVGQMVMVVGPMAMVVSQLAMVGGHMAMVAGSCQEWPGVVRMQLASSEWPAARGQQIGEQMQGVVGNFSCAPVVATVVVAIGTWCGQQPNQ
jgi:hypothetical protein